MAHNIQNPSNKKYLGHIGAQFEHFTQTRTSSRLREMSHDLKDAVERNKITEEQWKAATSAPESGPHFTQVQRAWTSLQGPSMAERTTGTAPSGNAVQRWLTEPDRAQAWSNVGAVPHRHDFQNDTKTIKAQAGAKEWSSKSVAGS